MARYGVQSSDSSGEEEVCKDYAKLYCEALTNLTPHIVPVLQNEIASIFAKCYSKGLVGKDMYTRGITLQDNSHQASQLLVMVSAQINIKPRFCRTFLKILRAVDAIEHIADRIEEEVGHLKRVKHKRRKQKNPGQGSATMPKLDLHEDGDSSGFYSEYSTKVAGDSGMSPHQTTPMESAGYDAGDDLDTSESQVGGYTHVSTEATTTPHQDNMVNTSCLPFTGSSEVVEETAEQNRSLEATEKIGSGVAESTPYMRSDSSNSRPVYPSHQGHDSSIGEGYESIHRLVESEKRKAQDMITEKDNTIFDLQQQLRIKENEQCQERRNHAEEIRQKEEELVHSVADIEQKSQDIESLKKAHEKQMKELEDMHRAKVEKITRELEMKSQLAQQNMEVLEQDLNKARDEKIALQKQKLEAEKEMEKLKLEHQKCLQEENKKHESEIEKLKLQYDKEIHKLEEMVEKGKSEAKHKEEHINLSHEIKSMKLEKKYKDDIATLKEKIHTLKEERTEADAQARICEAKMDTQRAEMQAQVDAKEAEIRIHRAESGKQLALREQAQEHEREKKEIVKTFCNTQRSVSSGSSSTNSITEEVLSIALMQMRVTRTSSNSGQSEDSKQQTPSEDCEQPFNEP